MTRRGPALLLLALALPASLGAAARAGRGGAAFLRVPIGARPAALGESFAGVADDGQAFFWNPAGLGSLRVPAFDSHHLFYYDETRLDAAVLTWPTRWGAVAAGGRWFTGPSIPRFRAGVESGRFDVVESAGEAAVAFGKRNLSVGFTGRYYRSRVDDDGVDALLADAGITKTWRRGRYRLGAVAQNMGANFGFGSTEDLKSPPPRAWRAGFAFRPGDRFLFSYELLQAQYNQAGHHAGVELWGQSPVTLRFGYVWPPGRERRSLDALAGWRLGTGIRAGGLSLDYAYGPGHALGDAHQVSLGFRFTRLTVLEEAGSLSLTAEPAYFSPNGDGRNDASFFLAGTQGLETVAKWRMSVRAETGNAVWQRNGRGGAPGLTEWNGRAPDGKVLPEGVYVVQSQVWSTRQQAFSAPRRVVLDVTPPEAEVTLSTAVFSPEKAGEDRVTFGLKARDRNPITGWRLDVVSRDAAPITVFSATGTFSDGTSSCSWNGATPGARGFAPNGGYDVTLRVEDAAGNAGAATTASLEVRVSPDAALRGLPPGVRRERVAGGFKLVVPRGILFRPARGPEISEDARDLLNTIVGAARAFPDRRLVLNGYCGTEKTAGRRRETASSQAWSLFSALVKAGVPANSLQVHGQGGAAGTADRVEILFLTPSPATPPAAPTGTAPVPAAGKPPAP